MGKTKDLDITPATWWQSPNKRLDSQWGRITYGHWCILEAARLTQKSRGEPCFQVMEAKNGTIAVKRVG